MDRLTFFKQGLSSAMDAVSAVVGLKKAVNTFTDVVDEALGDIKSDIGLYMRSIESDMYEGARGTLKDVARMGYTTIETDSYFGGKIYDLKPADFRKAADEAGLKITSAHLRKFYDNDLPEPDGETEALTGSKTESAGNAEAKSAGTVESSEETEGRPAVPVDAATNSDAAAGNETADGDTPQKTEDPVMKWWEEALAVHKTLGCRYIVISRLPDALTPETAERYADYFVRIGDMVLRHGMRLLLHPSRRELTATDGTSIFDIMAARMPADKVWFELDTREAHEAAVDMVSMLKHYKGRVLLLHLQDFGIATESGLIDFDKIVNEAIATAVNDIFVEVRSYTLPPKNCVERSIYNLESLPSLRY